MNKMIGSKQEIEFHSQDNKLSSGPPSVVRSDKPAAMKSEAEIMKVPSQPQGLKMKSPRRSSSKKTGCRQARRIENTKFLLTLLDEDYTVKEPDITDFISSHQSAFEQLFLQHENMEIWSEFMNRSGEEQDRFLEEVEEGMIRVAKNASLQQDKNGNAFTKVEAKPKPQTTGDPSAVKDKRIEHPAHTPKQCFEQISSRLQTMLRRRHLPKGAVEKHEEDLMSWFTDDPDSVFISNLPSSYDRLLLHAVCQYLDLSSESFESGGQRQTKVENKREFFHPPDMLLSAYLDTLTVVS